MQSEMELLSIFVGALIPFLALIAIIKALFARIAKSKQSSFSVAEPLVDAAGVVSRSEGWNYSTSKDARFSDEPTSKQYSKDSE